MDIEEKRTLVAEARRVADIGVQFDDGNKYLVPAADIARSNELLRQLADLVESGLEPEPLVEPVSGNSDNPGSGDFIQRCSDCHRERTINDFNDYNPLQVVTGQPIGWYSGSDGEICGGCMAKMMGRANS